MDIMLNRPSDTTNGTALPPPAPPAALRPGNGRRPDRLHGGRRLEPSFDRLDRLDRRRFGHRQHHASDDGGDNRQHDGRDHSHSGCGR
jgi:hypothetical protein